MPIQVFWDNEDHTIIRYVFAEPWVWSDLRAAVTASNSMLDSVDHKVHFIHDVTAITSVPLDTLTHLRSLVDKEHPHTGQSVIVGGKTSAIPKILKGMFAMIHKLYQKDWGFYFVDTIDDARELLAEWTRKKV
jgi:hypothetical protein